MHASDKLRVCTISYLWSMRPPPQVEQHTTYSYPDSKMAYHIMQRHKSPLSQTLSTYTTIFTCAQ